jgi:ABC-2 type transport system permease protein
MSTTTLPADRPRRTTALGGFSLTFVTLELRRMLRNKRTLIFTLMMPSVFFLLFGTDSGYQHQRAGNGNVTAYILISMAVYGAMLATTSGGAAVSVERAVGWSRQLRLTPLNPLAYVAVKLVVAMTLGLVAVVVVFAVGSFFGADMPSGVWVGSGLLAWLCAVVFAAFGLFMGYLLPSENVMQILGPMLAGLAAIGGLWFPISSGSTLGHISAATPIYGLAQMARWPLYGGAPHAIWVINLVGWLAVFVAGAAWRMSKDTARV